MKTTLSINTVGSGTQISLQKGNEVFYCDVPFAKHSETLFDTLEAMLQAHNVNLCDITCIGVVTGPGSFTGIRIGLSVAKTFAYVHNIPIVAVNSLEVLAYNIFDKTIDVKKVCSVMNAGAGQVYYQIFDVKKQGLQYDTLPRVETIAHFMQCINDIDDLYVISLDKIEGICDCNIMPFSATSLHKCITQHIRQDDFCDNAQVQPLYLRLAQVEVCKVDFSMVDMPKAQESESMALCGIDNQQDDWYKPFNVYDWQTKLIDPNFVCYQLVFKGSLIGVVAYTKKDSVAIIERLIVDKRARNQGVAKYAINQLIQKLQQQKIKSLNAAINANNMPAINLFGACGFKIKTNNDEDVVLLTKKLV